MKGDHNNNIQTGEMGINNDIYLLQVASLSPQIVPQQPRLLTTKEVETISYTLENRGKIGFVHPRYAIVSVSEGDEGMEGGINTLYGTRSIISCMSSRLPVRCTCLHTSFKMARRVLTASSSFILNTDSVYKRIY